MGVCGYLYVFCVVVVREIFIVNRIMMDTWREAE